LETILFWFRDDRIFELSAAGEMGIDAKGKRAAMGGTGMNGLNRRAKAGITFVLIVLLGCCIATTGALGAAHEYVSSFGPDGTEATSFEYPGAIGVDESTHTLYVANLEGSGQGSVSKFDGSSGSPSNFSALSSNEIGGFSFTPAEGCSEIAVNESSHDFYVAALQDQTVKAYHANGTPAEFTAGPGTGTNTLSAVGEVCGVAVDGNGDIYVGDYTTGSVEIFAPSGAPITSISASAPTNVVVDAAGSVYVASYQGAVEKLVPDIYPVTPLTTYLSQGQLDPGSTLALGLDRTTGAVYVDRKNAVVEYDEAGNEASTFAEFGPGAVVASEGVAVDDAAGKVYVSDIEGSKRVNVYLQLPEVPPTIESTSAADVTATGADLEARINSSGFTTTYRFQYVTQAQFEISGFAGALETGPSNLGSRPEARTAAAHVGGLDPETTYRFRVIAENEHGVVETAEPVPAFLTYPLGGEALPDGRGYELVSPPEKAGEVMAPDREALLGGSCSECLPGSANGQGAPMQAAPDGEGVAYAGQPFTADLAPATNVYLSQRATAGWGPAHSLTNGHFVPGRGFEALASDLSRGIVSQIAPALSPAAPSAGGVPYENIYLWEGGVGLHPLLTQEPPDRSPGEGPNSLLMRYGAANAGSPLVAPFTHVAFAANDALTGAVPGTAPAAPAVSAEGRNLYEWAEGRLRLVNVLPGNGAASPDAVLGSGFLLVEGKNAGTELPGTDHAISDDGNKIFWSDSSGQVFARIAATETREVADNGRFLDASTDGSRVLLDDGCLYDLATETCQDLTAGLGGFKGYLGAAGDLSRIYFVDTAAISPGQENANEEHAEAGQFNLFAWQEGAIDFVGRLEAGDNRVEPSNAGGFGDWRASASNRTAQVSGNGRYLAFMSRAALTGYDNEAGSEKCRVSQTPVCYEVFVYDASLAALSCASCSPTGQRPSGGANLTLISPGQGDAKGRGLFPLRQPGNLSAEGSGRVFFESRDALTPRDSNGAVQDVYEWEPAGVGGCGHPQGCVALISSGSSPNDSLFVDSTPSGDDAFFVTRQRLLRADGNDQLDLYDARVGGGFDESPATTCLGDSCRGQSPPQAAMGPASNSAAGHNAHPARCAKGKVRRHDKCVRKHRKKHGRHQKKPARHGKKGGAK
jgi:DNA-binding beta-propeller fold protein YncE